MICGEPWFDATFAQLDASIVVEWLVAEGTRVAAGTHTLQRAGRRARPYSPANAPHSTSCRLMSATATAARRFVDAVAGTGCEILDTRKTIPGLRTAQKYATRRGRCRNHRMGLYDAVLIKENHIAAAGSIAAAVAAARATTRVSIEVEVESLDELRQALAARPDSALLDDFSLDELRAAVALNRSHGSCAEARGVRRHSPQQRARHCPDWRGLHLGRITHQARRGSRPVDAHHRLTRACSAAGRLSRRSDLRTVSVGDAQPDAAGALPATGFSRWRL